MYSCLGFPLFMMELVFAHFFILVAAYRRNQATYLLLKQSNSKCACTAVGFSRILDCIRKFTCNMSQPNTTTHRHKYFRMGDQSLTQTFNFSIHILTTPHLATMAYIVTVILSQMQPEIWQMPLKNSKRKIIWRLSIDIFFSSPKKSYLIDPGRNDTKFDLNL